MNEMMQLTLWGTAIVLVTGLGVVLIDWLLRSMVNCMAQDNNRFPHRIATELPRTLRKGDHDEVIELRDQTN